MTFKSLGVMVIKMATRFTEEEREGLRTRMLGEGFAMLRAGGMRAVNIDELTAHCYVAKGTFYNLFESKAEFLYQVMRFKRQEAKDRLVSYLSCEGRLSRTGLRSYLHWLADENPNIFSYLDGRHVRWLVSKWPPEYLEDEENDEQTARGIISLLERPKHDADWRLFCNYLKLIALALADTDYLIAEAVDPLLDELIERACDCVCDV